MNRKKLALLGFAAKSGNLSFGFKSAVESLEADKAKLILFAEDVSAKSQKEIGFQSNKKNIPVFSLKGVTIETLSNSIGRKCGIVSVNEKGFAQSLKEEILNDQ